METIYVEREPPEWAECAGCGRERVPWGCVGSTVVGRASEADPVTVRHYCVICVWERDQALEAWRRREEAGDVE